MSEWSVRPLRAGEGAQVGAWTYPPPFDIYEVGTDAGEPSAKAGYLAVVDDTDALVGFVVLGSEARVPGLEVVPGVVDIGVGMRPDLVGRGLGRKLGRAIGRMVNTRPEPHARIVVKKWNQRSLRLARALGFEPTTEIENDAGAFLILERHLPFVEESRLGRGGPETGDHQTKRGRMVRR